MEQLLVTKLFIPPTRAKLVHRPGLIERLNDGLDRKLTLLSAPAGFGKTTVVSHWVENLRNNGEIDGQPIKVVWLSLDEDDNDPVRFLTYFIAALNQNKGIEAQLGQGALSMLQAPQPPSANTILISLINDLAAIPEKIIFVLDDYHLIESEPIHQALVYLLENLPPQLHLVIATRQDPHLPLGRLRARDQLTELRAADLRFTSSEAADFLNQVMGLNLSSGDIAELETRTEGWIAGLQLAAISMQGRKDRTGFIKSFSGGHRLVLDFLIEEVLGQQPESIRNFLLQTAILNRLTGSLCDAVTDQENGQQTLEDLERANLFIVPLDNERRWYRYHHLFADLLRRQMHQTMGDLKFKLHSRARQWYEQNKLLDEATDHALAAKDFKQAANLIEQQVDAIWERGEHAKLLKWTSKLPKEQLSTRPQMAILHAWVQLEVGEVKAAEISLKAVDHAIKSIGDKASKEDPEHITHLDTAHLKSRVSVMRAMIGFRKADVPNIIKFSREALESLPEKDLSWRSIAAMALGDSQYIVGNMNAANSALSEAISISKNAGNTYITTYASIKLAIVLQYQGKLHQALDICRELMAFMNTSGLSGSSMNGVLHAEWGEILWDLNEIDDAFQFVSRGIELSELEIDLTNLAWIYLVLVKVLYAKRDFAAATKTILKLEKIAGDSHVPTWIDSRIAAWKARIWLTKGDFDAVQHWVQVRQLNTKDDPLFEHEVEYIVLARFLILRDELEEAVNLLERLIEKAEAGGRITRTIEMALVLSLALLAKGETHKAVATLRKSLSLAESGGHIRLFVNEGPPMAQLLYEALDRGIMPDYVHRLLAAFPIAEPEGAASTKPQADQSELIEPLSEREIEVLQLIAQGLTNSEIATRLFLSPHTVKVHARNIYGKFGAHNRTEAVARARALGIL
ncbi:MAG: LuxR C-terminal-related transcriptional regulator [Anaerolineales bacterium]